MPDTATIPALKQRYRDQRPQIERLKKERTEARKQAAAVRVNRVVWQKG